MCHPQGVGEHFVNRRYFPAGALASLWVSGSDFRSPTSPAQQGIDSHYDGGAFGASYLPETLGLGCAFLDHDGWLDILLIIGMDWPGKKRHRSTLKLYRNTRNGAGRRRHRPHRLAVETYGTGVAVAERIASDVRHCSALSA